MKSSLMSSFNIREEVDKIKAGEAFTYKRIGKERLDKIKQLKEEIRMLSEELRDLLKND